MLVDFIKQNKSAYANIEFDNTEIDKQLTKHHDWNYDRFVTLGKIRNESLVKTILYGCDYYFVADCDNFVLPHTLKSLLKHDVPIIAPFLISDRNDWYSNYHYEVDANGYFSDHEMYRKIFSRDVVGVIEVKVVHCTYLVRADAIPHLNYDDKSGRYEYVIFSHCARLFGNTQYLDNKDIYGLITFKTEKSETVDFTYDNLPTLIDRCNLFSKTNVVSKKNDKNTEQRTLVVSPQAGLGNRLRVMASAIVLAKQLNMKIFHAWNPIQQSTLKDGMLHVSQLQDIGFEELFIDNDNLQKATKSNIPNIDVCFSEWLPIDKWYYKQNNAQNHWEIESLLNKRYGDCADDIAKSNANIILYESSKAIKLSKELGGCKTNEEWESELHNAYSNIIPREKYTKLIKEIENSEVGISIRRGDFINYFPESNQDLGDLKKWAINISKTKKVAIFSDDLELVNDFNTAILDANGKIADCANIYGINSIESDFAQFLYLATKCDIVCGTPNSSFAKEASIFGNKKYFHNLQLINN